MTKYSWADLAKTTGRSMSGRAKGRALEHLREQAVTDTFEFEMLLDDIL